jgi:hypothetical protein
MVPVTKEVLSPTRLAWSKTDVPVVTGPEGVRTVVTELTATAPAIGESTITPPATTKRPRAVAAA